MTLNLLSVEDCLILHIMIIDIILWFHHSPWYATSFQHIGDAHIPGPDIKLPFLQPQNTTQDGARVDPDPHVHVKLQLLPHIPGLSSKTLNLFY